MAGFLKKLLSSRNERLIKRYAKTVGAINALEDGCRALDDAGLRAKTDEFRARLAQGESRQALLPEAFAVVREAARRTLGMRHFDAQLIGGMVLNDGKIAEMRTGEGKTLVATLPTYLNALAGGSVHIVTVNDYLARRDAEWMGKVYEFLGLSVGVIVSGQGPEERKAAYAAAVAYGTNNEFGFDYLRDNMVLMPEYRVQRGRDFAIVDEVDSILIDEARTPLIISGSVDDKPELYRRVDQVVARLQPAPDGDGDGDGDYTIEEKSKQVFLTEQGHEHIEQLLATDKLLEPGGSLYDLTSLGLLHHVNAALRARTLFRKNVDYLVRDGQVLIVDEFTGRVMAGRRWSEGLHQAIEAKERVAVQSENQTLASITFQNYFRLYDTLSGMTGTADTEAYEFQQIYSLEVVVVPTHKRMVRDDFGDLVYVTAKEKYDAIIADVKDCMERGQPVLVGTASIEVSEYLSGLLKKAQLGHQVLNAKHHESESRVIANAGRPCTVTIATNMAGRGTDIVLGGASDAEPAADEEQADAEPAAGEGQADAEPAAGEGQADAEPVAGEGQADAKPVAGEGQSDAEPAAGEADFQSEARQREAEQAAENHSPLEGESAGRSPTGGEQDQRRRGRTPEDDGPTSQVSLGSGAAQADADWQARHEAVVTAGGLHIIGTERHESRRIDNQLRGRSGRQGDPGSSRFYLSLEDSLMRIFAGDKVKAIMGKLGVQPGEAIEHPWVTRAIENAQGKVEGHNFDIRKSLLEYDDVANEQRKVVYRQRDELLDSDDVGGSVETIMPDVIGDAVDRCLPPDVVVEDWDAAGLEKTLQQDFALACPVAKWHDDDEDLGQEALAERVIAQARAAHRAKEQAFGAQRLRQVEKILMLQVLDMHWKEHLAAMDYLRQGIGLRSFAQRNPRQEYKREAFEMFEVMLQRVRYDFISRLFLLQIEKVKDDLEERKAPVPEQVTYHHDSAADALHPPSAAAAADARARPGPAAAPAHKAARRDQKKAARKVMKKMAKRLTSEQIRAAAEMVSAGKPMNEAVAEVAGGAGGDGQAEAGAMLQTVRRSQPKVGRNDPCHCGSGKKYKHCHGKAA